MSEWLTLDAPKNSPSYNETAQGKGRLKQLYEAHRLPLPKALEPVEIIDKLAGEHFASWSRPEGDGLAAPKVAGILGPADKPVPPRRPTSQTRSPLMDRPTGMPRDWSDSHAIVQQRLAHGHTRARKGPAHRRLADVRRSSAGRPAPEALARGLPGRQHRLRHGRLDSRHRRRHRADNLPNSQHSQRDPAGERTRQDRRQDSRKDAVHQDRARAEVDAILCGGGRRADDGRRARRSVLHGWVETSPHRRACTRHRRRISLDGRGVAGDALLGASAAGASVAGRRVPKTGDPSSAR